MAARVKKGQAVVTLPTDTQILITREFDAPKRLVYEAWTTPELVKRWWHAKRGEVTVADIDLRVGGTWRWAMRTERGLEVAFHGEYRELIPDERIVFTEVFEGMPGEGVLTTLTLIEENGRTTLALLVEAGSREVRDVIMGSGMEAGVQDAWDLLEQVAISLM
jgi:uncharacterized protein YndB with AHSA1/START domain